MNDEIAIDRRLRQLRDLLPAVPLARVLGWIETPPPQRTPPPPNRLRSKPRWPWRSSDN